MSCMCVNEFALLSLNCTAFNISQSRQFQMNPTEFSETARAWTRRHASPSSAAAPSSAPPDGIELGTASMPLAPPPDIAAQSSSASAAPPVSITAVPGNAPLAKAVPPHVSSVEDQRQFQAPQSEHANSSITELEDAIVDAAAEVPGPSSSAPSPPAATASCNGGGDSAIPAATTHTSSDALVDSVDCDVSVELLPSPDPPARDAIVVLDSDSDDEVVLVSVTCSQPSNGTASAAGEETSPAGPTTALPQVADDGVQSGAILASPPPPLHSPKKSLSLKKRRVG